MVSKSTLFSILTLVAVNNASAVAMPAWLSSAYASAKGYVSSASSAVCSKATTAQLHLTSGATALKGYAHSASKAVAAQASSLKNNACMLLELARAVTLNDVKGAVLSKQGATVGAAAVVAGAAVYYKSEIKDSVKAGYNKIASLATRK
jgi:hypothetical protein